MTLRKRRLAHGALELTMPEVKVDLDKHGRVTGAHVVENTESHQIIEEFMLAANEAVAETLRDKGLHFLRRVHQSPSPQKLKALTEFVARAGLQDREPGKPLRAAEAAGRGDRPARAARRPLRRAALAAAGDLQPEGGRPLRLGQRVLLPLHLAHPPLSRPDGPPAGRCAARPSRKPRNDYDELVVLGRHCSDREQRAEAAERELTKLKLLAYLSDADRRGDGRRGDRRGELRPVRPRHRSCRPKG